MISYRLYLDESGTHKGAERIFLAGSMMSIDEWDEIDAPWCEVLGKYGLDFFHAKEVWGNHPQRIDLFRELAKLIFNRNFAAWWGGVHKTDFEKIILEYSRINMNMFELLLFGSIGGCHQAMKFLGDIGKLGVIIENGHPPIRQWARDMIKVYEKNTGIFEHPWLESPKGPIPLQVADYVAWNYNRYVERQATGLPFIEMINQNNLQRFWGANFDEELLRKTFAQIAAI